MHDTSRAHAFAHGSHVVGRAHGGTRAHRSVTHPSEYVDDALLLAEVERLLGFTRADVHRCLMSGGRIRANLLPLRDRLDARILELHESGANMAALRRVLGIPSRRIVTRAIARARA